MTSRHTATRRSLLGGMILAVAIGVGTISEPASAAERSAGLYRIPYAPGTTVEIIGDAGTHSPPNRIDMRGRGGTSYRIVAAAGGVVRRIVDRYDERRPNRNPCNNNYIWIEHSNGEWTKYSHMVKGSVTRSAGLSEGERVRAGTFLGYEGEVGCASRKHLHFEVGVPEDPDNAIDDQGFLNGNPAPNRDPRVCGIADQTYHDGETHVAGRLSSGYAEYERRGLTVLDLRKLVAEARTCGYRATWVDGYTRSGDTRFNLILEPNTPTRNWQVVSNLTAAQYENSLATYRARGYRMIHVDVYATSTGLRYAAVFDSRPGPAFTEYHGKSPDQHQRLLEALVREGWRPRVLSVASVGGRRYYASLYVGQSIGAYEARSFLTPAQFEAKVSENAAQGRRPIYLNAYVHAGKPYLTAIWASQPATAARVRYGLSGAEYHREWLANTSAGWHTRAVTGYEYGGRLRFAGYWRR